MPKVVAIIQARSTSTRLPGKIWADIRGKPMLWHVVNRVSQVDLIDEVVIAMPVGEKALLADELYFFGHEHDVLDRYYQCAERTQADVIVRITGDCPLHDPKVIERVISLQLDSYCDYVCNVAPRTYPDGLDCEVFSADALRDCWHLAEEPDDREHVMRYILNHPERFRIGNIANDTDLSQLRWTVDMAEDLAFVRSVYADIGRYNFGMQDVLEWLKGKERG